MKSAPHFTRAALAWLESLIEERFGGQWVLNVTSDSIKLSLRGSALAITFDPMSEKFTQPTSEMPISYWDGRLDGWDTVFDGPLPAPGLASLQSPLIEPGESGFVVHYDLLGFVYWMLARVEEIDNTDVDSHGRFPASSSHALKNGYLTRPIVDEWFHVLGLVISKLWPCFSQKTHSYRLELSHDVDCPARYGFASWRTVARRMAGDMFRLDLKSAVNGPRVKVASSSRLHPLDPYNTFPKIMDLSEQRGVASTFYFICGKTSAMEGDYDVRHPAIRRLLREIHGRGHHIGLHPSYGTFCRPEQLSSELARLRDVLFDEGVTLPTISSRMHYLRWQTPDTLRNCAEVGIHRDSTLAYADQVGFRCGTCFDYQGFDPVQQKACSVRIRPLVAMDTTILSKNYMNLDESTAFNTLSILRDKCKKVGGSFTLLWHNNEIHSMDGLYERFLSNA